jgi:hypothetical protein
MANSDSEDYGLFSSEFGPEPEPGLEPELGPDIVDVRLSASRGAPPENAAPAAKNLYERLKGKMNLRGASDPPTPQPPQLFADHIGKTSGGQGADPGGATGAELGCATDDLRKAFQICLDDEANLAGLEDPDLVEHMELARATYAEKLISEKRYAPNLDELKANHKQILVEINSLLRAMEEQKAERQRNTDEICVHGSNAKRLSACPVANVPPPHGYPALKSPVPPECLEAFKRLSVQIAEDGELSQKSVAFCEDALKKLTLLRRGIEGLLDALWRLAENPGPTV